MEEMDNLRRRFMGPHDYCTFISQLTDRDCMELVSVLEKMGEASPGDYKASDAVSVTKRDDGSLRVHYSNGSSVRNSVVCDNYSRLSMMIGFAKSNQAKENGGRLLNERLEDEYRGSRRRD